MYKFYFIESAMTKMQINDVIKKNPKFSLLKEEK